MSKTTSYDSSLSLVKACDLEDKEVCGFYFLYEGKPHIKIPDIPWKNVHINPYTVCRNTGIKIGDSYLYENDIVSYFEPMRATKLYGYIDFDDFYRCYVVRTGIEQRATRLLKDCSKIEITGRNIFLNDEDFIWFAEWEKSKFEESKSHVIDNSYCPSKFRR